MLGQEAVDKKSNEITAIPKLLEQLELEGCIITTGVLTISKNTLLVESYPFGKAVHIA